MTGYIKCASYQCLQTQVVASLASNVDMVYEQQAVNVDRPELEIWPLLASIMASQKAGNVSNRDLTISHIHI